MARLDLRRCALFAALTATIVACGQHYAPGLPPASTFEATAGDASGGHAVEIQGIGKDDALDKLVVKFMLRNGVPNAQLAVSKSGTLSFSHAYTYRRLAPSTTTRATLIRLASLSKAWTSAALYELISAHKIDPNWKVFRYLGITKPLPAGAHVDPRVYDITIEDMIQHESGWDDSISHYDPTFSMRKTAIALGLGGPIDQTQEVRYQLHKRLQQKPGTTYAYCNFCYTVLGMVVAKASKMTYQAYLTNVIGAKLNEKNVLISPTVGKRLPNEVARYYNPYSGRSALYIRSDKRYPWPYSGDGMLDEVVEGAGGLATNAESMVLLMNKYIIWGVGTPPPSGYFVAREGEMPGANTYAEQLPNGTNYAFLVNTNAYAYGSNPNAFLDLQNDIVYKLL